MTQITLLPAIQPYQPSLYMQNHTIPPFNHVRSPSGGHTVQICLSGSKKPDFAQNKAFGFVSAKIPLFRPTLAKKQNLTKSCQKAHTASPQSWHSQNHAKKHKWHALSPASHARDSPWPKLVKVR